MRYLGRRIFLLIAFVSLQALAQEARVLRDRLAFTPQRKESGTYRTTVVTVC